MAPRYLEQRSNQQRLKRVDCLDTWPYTFDAHRDVELSAMWRRIGCNLRNCSKSLVFAIDLKNKSKMKKMSKIPKLVIGVGPSLF